MLEIMIVIAILGLVMGLVVVPKIREYWSGSRTQIAKLAVDQLAMKDYPMWAMAHGNKECPDELLDVVRHAGKKRADLEDPWGTDYKMRCGRGHLPDGVTDGIAVWSFGADRADATVDDIKSWEPLR